MPFNATSYSNSNINKKENASATNNDHTPSFIAGAVDNSQAEVAKTFNFREFGNGSANAGTGNVSYADATMLASDVYQATAYVMDDGLTSQAGATRFYSKSVNPTGANTSVYWVFIGTGITCNIDYSSTPFGQKHIGQNLPYGTHILEIKRKSNNALTETYLDSILLNSNGLDGGGGIPGPVELSYHQPKMPPIPEDAVVIADYMLMADFVKTSSGNQGHISKGVRYLSSSRDVFYDQTSNITSGAGWASSITRDIVYPQGYTTQGQGTGISAGSASLEVPYFGTDAGMTGYTGRTGTTHTESINSTSVSASFINSGRESRVDVTGQTLQLNGFKSTWTTSEMFITSIELAIPIHTSSHYQTFESPFLHELVGGDRNMEQTNLVVTPDGKTWDEVTRDTSYLSPNLCVSNITVENSTASNTVVIFNQHRGNRPSERRIDCYFKDFAYAHDRFICLVNGQYEFFFHTYTGTSQDHYIKINGLPIARAYGSTGNTNVSMRAMGNLKRGDYVQLFGGHFLTNDDMHTGFFITRLGER